ncbi:LysR substrate-binding domain-containing protein [Halocynthiibacter sp.]|uniref:LysR substrate-binding domain-containing protein n=1 Tax=Halocynthiibacter sp. TaxID=1979210 RepID=UPI003C6A3615
MPFIPSIAALRAFEAAARHENFRKAAEELHITHGAVAQQIRGLEADLKTHLFQRLTRGVRLTPSGKEYAERVLEGLTILRDATDDVMGKAQNTPLILTATPSFANCWLLPRLARFSEHSTINLQVSASETVVNLLAGEADLAIRQSPPPYGRGIAHQNLLSGRNVIVGAPNWMRGKKIVEDLMDTDLLHDGHGGWPGYFQQHLGELPAGAGDGLRFNQAAMCIRLACDGKGVALVPEALVQNEISEGRLEVFEGPQPQDGAGFYLVWPEKHGRRRDVSRVCDWLVTETGYQARA